VLIHLAEGRSQWRAVENMVMNPRVIKNASKYVDKLSEYIFSRRFLLRGVS
jgi:hypothetical protein